jgi:hypothetical protein
MFLSIVGVNAIAQNSAELCKVYQDEKLQCAIAAIDWGHACLQEVSREGGRVRDPALVKDATQEFFSETLRNFECDEKSKRNLEELLHMAIDSAHVSCSSKINTGSFAGLSDFEEYLETGSETYTYPDGQQDSNVIEVLCVNNVMAFLILVHECGHLIDDWLHEKMLKRRKIGPDDIFSLYFEIQAIRWTRAIAIANAEFVGCTLSLVECALKAFAKERLALIIADFGILGSVVELFQERDSVEIPGEELQQNLDRFTKFSRENSNPTEILVKYIPPTYVQTLDFQIGELAKYNQGLLSCLQKRITQNGSEVLVLKKFDYHHEITFAEQLTGVKQFKIPNNITESMMVLIHTNAFSSMFDKQLIDKLINPQNGLHRCVSEWIDAVQFFASGIL